LTLSVEKPVICPVLIGRDQELAALGHLLNQRQMLPHRPHLSLRPPARPPALLLRFPLSG